MTRASVAMKRRATAGEPLFFELIEDVRGVKFKQSC
jgi:hypothetical protein